jgi:hypothetical protein
MALEGATSLAGPLATLTKLQWLELRYGPWRHAEGWRLVDGRPGGGEIRIDSVPGREGILSASPRPSLRSAASRLPLKFTAGAALSAPAPRAASSGAMPAAAIESAGAWTVGTNDAAAAGAALGADVSELPQAFGVMLVLLLPGRAGIRTSTCRP